MMSNGYISVDKLEKIKILAEEEIYQKKRQINMYLTYRLRKYLSFRDTSKSYTYIISYLDYTNVIVSELICKFEYKEICISIDRNNIEHFDYSYMQHFQKHTYDFLSFGVLDALRGSLHDAQFENLYSFSHWIQNIGISKLIDNMKNLKDKLFANPILEIREACITFICCCKYGGVPISRDISRKIAQIVWESRYSK